MSNEGTWGARCSVEAMQSEGKGGGTGKSWRSVTHNNTASDEGVSGEVEGIKRRVTHRDVGAMSKREED